jgi:adenylate kinase
VSGIEAVTGVQPIEPKQGNRAANAVPGVPVGILQALSAEWHQVIGFPKSAIASRAAERQDKKRQKDAELRRVKRLVRARDKSRCRACNSRDSIEVHHVKFRSAGGVHSTKNCACLCAICHADLHAYRLTISGNADSKLTIERTQ